MNIIPTRQFVPPNERQFHRHSLIYQLSVLDAETLQHLGYLTDISLGGALLVSDHLIHTGMTLKIRVLLPSAFLKVTDFDLDVTIIRVNKDVNIEYLAVGLRFLNVSPEQQQLIEYLIEKYSF